jgi:hypothetical protein
MQSPVENGERHKIGEVPLPDAVARACHDINSALAAVMSCFEYIAETTRGTSHDAADDGRAAARRIAALIHALNERCRASKAADAE